MHRSLAGLLALTLVVLVACHSSEGTFTATGIQVHWQQTSTATLERRVTVVVPAQYASSSLMWAVNTAVVQADRSPYLDFVIHSPQMAPTSCPTMHCILVTRGQLPYPTLATTSWGWDSQGHMHGLAVRVVFDSDPIPQAVFNNAGCHEIAGHGTALKHSSDGTQGPCQSARLTDHDLSLIAKGHNHRDGQVYPTVTGTAEVAGILDVPVRRVEKHTRQFYEEMSR